MISAILLYRHKNLLKLMEYKNENNQKIYYGFIIAIF